MRLGLGPESSPLPAPRCFPLPRVLPFHEALPRHARTLPDVLGLDYKDAFTSEGRALGFPESWGDVPDISRVVSESCWFGVSLCRPAFGGKIVRICFSQNAAFYFAATKCPMSLIFVQLFKCQHGMILP